MPTITQLRELVATKLASASDIQATEHREVENAIIDYIEALEAGVLKSKVVVLDIFTTNRNYSVSTELASPKVISSVLVLLECKVANNGFAIGDIINSPSPYVNGGIGVQFTSNNPTAIKVMTNDEIWVMTPYNAASGADANNIMIKNATAANWKIRLIIGYI